jgi:hypothetical protein
MLEVKKNPMTSAASGDFKICPMGVTGHQCGIAASPIPRTKVVIKGTNAAKEGASHQ